jgi:hypothetical protein
MLDMDGRAMNLTSWARAFNCSADSISRYWNANDKPADSFAELVKRFGEPKYRRPGKPRKNGGKRKSRKSQPAAALDVRATFTAMRALISTSTKPADTLVQIEFLLEKMGY